MIWLLAHILNILQSKNRGQKYPLQGVTGFNQVVIKLQLILNIITICDYNEEKYDDDQDTRPNFKRGVAQASRVIIHNLELLSFQKNT